MLFNVNIWLIYHNDCSIIVSCSFCFSSVFFAAASASSGGVFFFVSENEHFHSYLWWIGPELHEEKDQTDFRSSAFLVMFSLLQQLSLSWPKLHQRPRTNWHTIQGFASLLAIPKKNKWWILGAIFGIFVDITLQLHGFEWSITC